MNSEKIGSDLIDLIVEKVARELLPEVMKELSGLLPSNKDITLDIKKASKYLDISEESLYKMCASKAIPHWKVGAEGSRRKTIRFSSLSLDQWKQEQEKINYLNPKES